MRKETRILDNVRATDNDDRVTFGVLLTGVDTVRGPDTCPTLVLLATER